MRTDWHVAMGPEVPPQPSHVNYDLRVPAACGKLLCIGPASAPDLWFTWCRPRRPFVPPIHSTPWLWVEEGPLFWVIDFVWRRDVASPAVAMKAAMTAGLEAGIVRAKEDVLFWRNSGRYGHLKVKGLTDGRRRNAGDGQHHHRAAGLG